MRKPSSITAWAGPPARSALPAGAAMAAPGLRVALAAEEGATAREAPARVEMQRRAQTVQTAQRGRPELPATLVTTASLERRARQVNPALRERLRAPALLPLLGLRSSPQAISRFKSTGRRAPRT